MRVAVVESAPYGGLLHYAGQLADALAERGHDAELLTARDNELDGRLRAARMRDVLAAAMPYPSEPPQGLAYVRRRAGIAVRLLRASTRTVWELRRGRYDAIVLIDDLNVTLAAGAALAVALLRGPATLVAICHEPRPRSRWAGDDLYAGSPLLQRTLRALYARIDLVLLHGERSQREFEAQWPHRRTAVIPHGDERVLGDEPPPPAEEERVLFFGDWRRAKGLHVLLEAFEHLEARRPQVRLTIAGTPSPDGDPERVRAWAAERRERVELIDRYVALEEVPGVFARARVVATPYIAGSQSGVVHLAMTMGRAVIASDVGELGSTVLDGVTGRVVPAGDAAALADALEAVVADPGLAGRLGDAGRRHLTETAGWDRVAERVETELQALR